jgi:tripartite-type tricarboxylate transporter receptor subunit TctC
MLRCVRNFIALAGACALAMSSTGLLAQAWPGARPIVLITGAAAGSGLDAVTRGLAQGLQEALGQSVVVDNRPGANQLLAADACAKARPDGYTFCTSSPEPHTTNHLLLRKLPYDPFKDFSYVAMLVTLQTGIIARSDLGVSTLPQLVALSKARPGSLNWGSFGNGSNSHLYLESLRAVTGWDVQHVPYKSSSDAVQALLGGSVQVIYNTLDAGIRSQIAAGKLTLLAVHGSGKRVAAYPGVPTFEEIGIGDYVIRSWWGVYGPAGIPADVVQRVNRAALDTVRKPEFAGILKATSVEPAPENTPADMAASIQRSRSVIAASLKRANVEPN